MDYPSLIAMVGGEGTRLYPLTLNISKPLQDICNQAVLTRLLDSLVLQGCRKIIISSKGYENTAQLNKYYRSGSAFFSRLNIDVFEEIEYQPNYNDRGSGDALRYCLDYYDIKGDVLVVGGDNLFDIDLDDLIRQHEASGALLTIGLKRVPESEDISQYGVAVVDDDMSLSGFVEKPDPGEEPSRLINTGIYLISPKIRGILPDMKVSVRDMGKDVVPYLVKKGFPVYGYLLEGYWADIGTHGRLLSTTLDILHGRLKNVKLEFEYAKNQWIHPYTIERTNNLRGIDLRDSVLIGRSCDIAEGVSIEDSSIGHTCIIEEGVVIRNSIVNSFSRIGKNSKLNNCVLGRYTTIGEGSIVDADSPSDVPVSDLERVPAIGGGGVTISPGTVIGACVRVAPLRQSYRILSTGKFLERGYDNENFYFAEKP